MPARLISTLLLFFTIAAAWSQPIGGGDDSRLTGLTAILGQTEAALAREGLTDDDLRRIRKELLAIESEAVAIAARARPQAAALSAQIEALRPAAPPDGGQPAAGPADDAVTQPPDPLRAEEQRVSEALQLKEATVKRADAVAARTRQMITGIDARLRERLSARIFTRSRGVFDPTLWRDAGAETGPTIRAIGIVGNNLAARARSRGMQAGLPPLILVVAVAFAFVPRLRRRLVEAGIRLASQREATRLSQAVTAVVVTVVVTAVPVSGYLIAVTLARGMGLLTDSLSPAVRGLGIAVFLTAATWALTRAVLAPARPDWRIARLDDESAERLARWLPIPAALVSLALIVASILAATTAPPAVLEAAGIVVLSVIGGSIVLTARKLRGALARARDEGLPARRLRLVRILVILATIAGFAAVASSLFGYVSFAWFLSVQVVWIAIVAGMFALLANWLDAASEVYLTGDHPRLARLGRGFGLDPAASAQAGVLASGVVKLAVAIAALLLVGVPFGLNTGRLAEYSGSLISGFEVGGLTISIGGLGIGLGVFLVILGATRLLKSWLADRFLPTTAIDDGLKNSIVAVTGYLGIITAIFVAFGSLGIDLSQLALVAGALSVGVGFGLQSIVNNFVSGLILLAERPIKVGDWVVVNNEQGIIRRINVRATELETFDRSTIVIPNSDLISGKVTNWNLSGPIGRISLNVGVAYGSDVEQVRDILLACAAAHPLTLETPEPRVFFMDFGASALDFRLDAFLANVFNSLTVRSELRFAVLKAFREAGIEIPFPQRDLNIRRTADLEDLLGGADRAPRDDDPSDGRPARREP